MTKNQMINKKIATPFLRLTAYLIDFGISFAPLILIVNIISSATDITIVLNRASLLVFLIIYPVFYIILKALMISTFGGTIGKLLTGTSIVTSDGKYLGFWRAIWRNWFGYTVSGLVLWAGFIWIFFNKDRQGWHDIMADSYVVVKNNWAIFVGVVSLFILTVAEFLLISSTIVNFKNNAIVYTSVYTEIQESIKESAKTKN